MHGMRRAQHRSRLLSGPLGGRVVPGAALLAGVVLGLAGLSAPAAGQSPAPNVPWPDLVPAFPTSTNPQPGPQPGCARPTMRCVDYEIERLQQAQDSFGCDHRAVFAT